MEKINWGFFALVVAGVCFCGLIFAVIAHRRTQHEIWEIQSQNIRMQDDIFRLKHPPASPTPRPNQFNRFEYVEPEMTR